MAGSASSWTVLGMLATLPLAGGFTVPVASKASQVGVLLASRADPFLDPVFTGVPAAEAVGPHWSPMVTGLACYAFGMAALTAWDEHVLPHIVERMDTTDEKKDMIRDRLGIAKPRPQEPAKDLSLQALAFARTPLPSLEQLKSSCHFVGTRSGWREWICTLPSQEMECKVNEDFTTYYGEPIYICRRPN